MSRPPGCSFPGATATGVRGLIGLGATDYSRIIIDSGADITLISEEAYRRIPLPPKPMKGQKVTLRQVTGKSLLQGFIKLPIIFDTPDGMVEISVDAYIVKGMSVSLIIGNDFADQYSLSLIQQGEQTFLELGSSGRRCPVENSVGYVLEELDGHSFHVLLAQSDKPRKKTHCGRRSHSEDYVWAAEDFQLKPEQVSSVPVHAYLPPGFQRVYVEGLVNSQKGKQDFFATPDSLLDKDHLSLHVANFSSETILIKKGDVLGLADPRMWLNRRHANAEQDRDLLAHAQYVKTLIHEFKTEREEDPAVEVEPPIEGGPKTAEVPPGEEIPSTELLKAVDLPSHLTKEQRVALENVIT